MMMKFKTLACLLTLMLFSFWNAGAEIAIEEVVTRIGENEVAYPQLSGMEDEAVQQKINDDIAASSGAANHMITLLTLTGQQKLTVEYKAYLNEDVFSTVISAKGKLPQKRDGHQYTALTYDLETGERVTLDQLFLDPPAAVEVMEEKAAEAFEEEMNGYLEFAAVTPLPADSFTLDETGITFWYPAEQFSLLSGYSGACQFWYEELAELWLNPAVAQLSAEEQKQAIEQSVAAGMVPHVPAQLGQSVQEIADAYRLLREPDEFPGGRYFLMEAPEFRQILLISDSLSADYASSVVEGIQLRRGGLHGLLIGSTLQTEWQELLAAPEKTIQMTESMAYDYGLCEGEYDLYQYGQYELRLYADREGVLAAIQICI